MQRFSNLLKDVLRRIGALRPTLGLGIALEQVTVVIGNLRNSNVTSRKSPEYRSMMGCVDAAEGLLKGGVPYAEIMTSSNQRLKEKVSEAIRSLLLLFFDFETANPLLMSLKIRSIRLFSIYYRLHPTVLTAVLERLLTMVLFRGPNEAQIAHRDLSRDTLKVRKEACDSFLRLCVELPDVLVSQLNNIASHVISKLIQGPTSFTEKAVLREALVAINAAQPDLSQRVLFLQKILGDVVAVWTGESMTATVNDCQQLLAWIGAAPGAEPRWDNGRALVSVLDTFRTTIKRSGEAAGDVLRAAIPNVFALCRTLHRLWKPGHPAHEFIKAKLPVIFRPSQQEFSNLLGKKMEKNFEVFVATWLSDTRNATYRVIGVSCKFPGFFKLPNLSNLLTTFVFAELSDVAVQHISLLVEYVVENLLKFAPQDAYVSFLGSLLPHMLAFFLERLHVCWAEENNVRRGLTTGRNADDEIVQAKLAADFSRAWLRVLMTLLHVEKGTVKGVEGHTVYSPLCLYMINSPPILMGLLATLTGALTETCDSLTLGHVMEILERLMSQLVQNVSLHPVLGGHLLHSLLKALSKRSNNELSMRLLRLSAEIYAKLRGAETMAVLKTTGVTAKCISSFEQRLKTVDGQSKKSPKNRALALQECLGDFIGSDVVGVGEGVSAFTQSFLEKSRKR